MPTAERASATVAKYAGGFTTLFRMPLLWPTTIAPKLYLLATPLVLSSDSLEALVALSSEASVPMSCPAAARAMALAAWFNSPLMRYSRPRSRAKPISPKSTGTRITSSGSAMLPASRGAGDLCSPRSPRLHGEYGAAAASGAAGTSARSLSLFSALSPAQRAPLRASAVNTDPPRYCLGMICPLGPTNSGLSLVVPEVWAAAAWCSSCPFSWRSPPARWEGRPRASAAAWPAPPGSAV